MVPRNPKHLHALSPHSSARSTSTRQASTY